jgi:signal transduction histidine kinase
VKKRIRYIFILMIICILGIIAVQGYWLYNAWHIAYDQFGRSINGALGEAAGHKGYADMKAYIREHPAFDPDGDSALSRDKNGTGNPRDKGRYFRGDGHPGSRRLIIRQLSHNKSGTSTDSSSAQPRNSGTETSDAPENPYWYFISERISRQPYKLSKLDTLYRDELEGRGIRAAFILDTQSTAHTAFRDKAFRRQWRNHTALQTHWVHTNPVSELYVRATFQTPYGYLFGKLLWILIASVILLAVTTWCFIFMLRTILKQKRWSEIKNDFISNMTHELKTPIATVSAAIEALQHFRGMEDKNKAQSYLDISHHELKRLSDLVEKVLHISIEENEEMVLHKEKVNIKTLIQGIIAAQQLKADKEVHFDFRCTPDNLLLQVDKLHFSNAINNLIDNAIKYSQREVNINIEVKLKANQLIFTLKDDGVGIPGHYHQLIFDKFFRVPTGDLHNVKGFGLGLNYVKKVVEKHGGTIHVKSEAGKGAEFTIILPLEDPAEAPSSKKIKGSKREI